MEDPMAHVRIFDTTLRDGEQTPGVALNTAQKIEIAKQLARLNVDIIEAGFPITSQGDFDAVQRIAREVRGPVICALARTAAADIERAAQALEPAAAGRIHVFTSGRRSTSSTCCARARTR
jgi:2-isopropylmalate synthase